MALKINVLGSGSVRLNVSSFKWFSAFLRERTVAAVYCHKEKTFDRHFEGGLVCLICVVCFWWYLCDEEGLFHFCCTVLVLVLVLCTLQREACFPDLCGVFLLTFENSDYFETGANVESYCFVFACLLAMQIDLAFKQIYRWRSSFYAFPDKKKMGGKHRCLKLILYKLANVEKFSFWYKQVLHLLLQIGP